MGTTFGEKFEEALAERRERDPSYGVRTLARELAKGDPKKMETIRRRLNKYRPKPGGGAAEVSPTEPTRREIEAALELDPDTLKPDEDLIAALAPGHRESDYLEALRPFARMVAEDNALVRSFA